MPYLCSEKMKRILIMKKSLCLATLCLCLLTTTQAKVKLPGWMTDNMVLQQHTTMQLSGQATGNTVVRISASWSKHDMEARSDSQGRFAFELTTPGAGGPYSLTFDDGEETVLRNVMSGEVWFCSGQSNMDMPIGAYGKVADWEAELAAADHPQIRLFKVAQRIAAEPQDDVPLGHTQGWAVCSPEMADAFSATAYFFAREVSQRLGVAVGVVSCAVGATPAESWVSREAVERVMGIDAAEGDASAVPENNRPSVLYNGMVAPFLSMPVRGILWYQGEHNVGRALQYESLFQTLILDWQSRFNRQAEVRPFVRTKEAARGSATAALPFLFVQLPNYMARVPVQPSSGWAWLREAQRKATRLEGTGMAVTIDIGDAEDIHPKNKQEVGHRLTLLALSQVYGKKVPSTAPNIIGTRARKGRMLLTFAPAEKGEALAPEDDIQGFIVAGPDHQWHAARAAYTKGRRRVREVVVECPDVEVPVAVRYAWGDNPDCNLRSRSGLPVGPFRTDDWP